MYPESPFDMFRQLPQEVLMDNKDKFVLLAQAYVQGLHLDEVAFELGLAAEERRTYERRVTCGHVFDVVKHALAVDVDFHDESGLGLRALQFVEFELAKEEDKDFKRPDWLPARQ